MPKTYFPPKFEFEVSYYFFYGLPGCKSGC